MKNVNEKFGIKTRWEIRDDVRKIGYHKFGVIIPLKWAILIGIGLMIFSQITNRTEKLHEILLGFGGSITIWGLFTYVQINSYIDGYESGALGDEWLKNKIKEINSNK